MLSITLQNNKRNFLRYNEWRKQIFIQNSPKDAHVVLYLLPWLLSVNHPSVPGYLKGQKHLFKVFDIENNRQIILREGQYKRQLGMSDDRFSIRRIPGDAYILGIYTIGSVGTVSQTRLSDCDIWICIDRRQFDDESYFQLSQKLNLIKGWLDEKIRIPVYFFLTDVTDIRECNFGVIDFESSGSTQKNVLKEEFYRTSILICGKIPFWWVAFDPREPVDYGKAFEQNLTSGFGEYDLIDLGNLEEVQQSEFYGAALWQLNKSLTHPLKSIIKMLLLKMFLETPREELLCNRFRALILGAAPQDEQTDPSVFTMQEILEHYSTRMQHEHFEFLKKCFYLRCDLKLMTRKQTQRDIMALDIFKKHKIERRTIFELNDFDRWGLDEQVDFGSLMFEHVSQIYRDIIEIQKGMEGYIAPDDLAIIGRKLDASITVKDFKVPILHMSTENIRKPSMTFSFHEGQWRIMSSSDLSSTTITHDDMIFCLAYITWNGIFDSQEIRMKPNPTPVTVQEIINIGKMMQTVFGTYDIARVHFGKFLEQETVNKMLVIISFEETLIDLEIQSIGIVYKNNWEELYVRRFLSIGRMKSFFAKNKIIKPGLEVHYYIMRNKQYYEKIIDRTKNVIEEMILAK